MSPSRARSLERGSGYRARFAFGAALLVASCRGSGPPPPELEALLPVALPSQAWAVRQHELRVEIESDVLSGEFAAVAATRAKPGAAARLQMFGELGGKVLDLAVREDGFTGYFPHAGVGVAHAAEGEPPRHLLTFLAASLLEAARPITGDRVLGARRVAGGWELSLVPLLPGVGLRATVSDSGELLRRDYSLRGARWTETPSPPRTFAGTGFRLTLIEDTVEEAPPLPDEVFRLELPEGFEP